MKKKMLKSNWQGLGKLLAEWNPIGVPTPADEYESLLPLLIRELDLDTPLDKIAALIEHKLEKEYGIGPPFDTPTINMVIKAKELHTAHTA